MQLYNNRITVPQAKVLITQLPLSGRFTKDHIFMLAAKRNNYIFGYKLRECVTKALKELVIEGSMTESYGQLKKSDGSITETFYSWK